MGRLATWGALAGAGTGLQELSKVKTKDRQVQEKITAEEQRALRLAEWQEGATERAETRTTEQERAMATWKEKHIDDPAREDVQEHELKVEREKIVGRANVADIGARSTAQAVNNRIFEYLAKGEDLQIKNEMNPATYEQELTKFHKPSGKLYKEWNATTGSLDFPSSRDPLDLAEKFGLTYDKKTEEKVRSQIIAKVSMAENLLLKAFNTASETSIRNKYQSMMGYLPLEYRRLTHARSVVK